jgi:hypothetical protein
MDGIESNKFAGLTRAAIRALTTGYCKYNKDDIERLQRLSKSGIERLSRILERGECLELRHGIDRAARAVPQYTVVPWQEEKKTSDRIKKFLDKVCAFQVEERMREYAAIHGWADTIDEQEVIDCWNEFVRAWEAFRQTTDELAGTK